MAMKSIRGFYTGCVNSGNIGDDILFDIFLAVMVEALQMHGITARSRPEPLATMNGEWERFAEQADIGVVGGGTIIHWCESSYTAPIREKLPTGMLFGTGIQPLCTQSEDAYRALEAGQYQDAGLEVNDIVKVNLARTRRLKHGGWRDPITAWLADDIDRPVMYDAGLLAPLYFPLFLREHNKHLLAVNTTRVVGPYRFGYLGESVDAYNARVSGVLWNFCLYAMAAGNSISGPYIGNDYADILSKYAACEAAIGTRLHSTVLSMAVGTPSVAIAYSLKTVGFYLSIGQLPLVAITGERFAVSKLMEKLEYATTRRKAIHEGVREHAMQAHALYLREMDAMLGDVMDLDGLESVTILYDTNTTSGMAKFILHTETA